jgi:hydroxypyruvate isomerase
MSKALRYEVNCSLLFTELPLLERPAAARAAGFDAVEFWWPFTEAVPADPDVDKFVAAVRDAGVQLAALNFVAGDMLAGERGVLSLPGRSAEYRDNVDVVVGIAAQLGCRAFNALYGNRADSLEPAVQDETATENLAFAARAVASVGGTVLVEPLSGVPAYPLRLAADALAVIDRVQAATGVANVALLADLYHLAANDDDLDRVTGSHASRIGHVQIADHPGRHEPGTGRLPLERHLASLAAHGYDGWVALEYIPASRTEDSFGWLPVGERETSGDCPRLS